MPSDAIIVWSGKASLRCDIEAKASINKKKPALGCFREDCSRRGIKGIESTKVRTHLAASMNS